MKRCYKCQKDKDLSKFYQDSSRKDGVSTKCKKCARTYSVLRDTTKDTDKKCPKCKKIKPLKDFNLNQNRGDGYQSRCRDCQKLHKNFMYDLNKEEERAKTLLRRYGLTYPKYLKILLAQNEACGICKRPFTEDGQAPHIDHDHVTGVVRGILCQRCNNGLGMLGDTILGLEVALEYLKKSASIDSLN